MLLRVDPHLPTPLFAQLADAVRSELIDGRLAPGDRLPAARQVAAALEINLHTVLHAYQQLRDEGLVQMHRGRGAVIAPAAARLVDLRADLHSLAAKARAAGLAPNALAALVRHAAETAPAPHPQEVSS